MGLPRVYGFGSRRLALLVSGCVSWTVFGCGRVGFELTPERTLGVTTSTGGSVGDAQSGAGGSVGAGSAASAGGMTNTGGVAGVGGGAGMGMGGVEDAGVGAGGMGTGGVGTGGVGTGGVGMGGVGTGGFGTGGVGTGGVGTGGAGTGGAPPLGVATSVAAGEEGTCAIANAGRLYCWGTNTSSALGGAGGATSSSPVQVQGPGTSGGFEEVAVGIRYACARHTNGGVWCWGENVHGQLGAGDTGIRPTPNPVNLPAAALRISAKFANSCATLGDGNLRCWGENAEGQMGQNDTYPGTDRPSPVNVPGTAAWRFSASGQGHVCGLQAPGSLWCWGRNVMSVLGTGSDQPGQIRTPTRIGTDADWLLVSSGQLSNCGIRSPGTLWCWGDNSSYQLGLGDTTLRPAPTRIGTASDWMSVSFDTFHGCGIRRPGTLWCWGRNDEGQVGMPFTGAVTTPTGIGTRSDWAEVSVGRFHSCARATDQTVWCTGENKDGRLGTGDTTRPYAFKAVAPFP